MVIYFLDRDVKIYQDVPLCAHFCMLTTKKKKKSQMLVVFYSIIQVEKLYICKD